MFERWFERIGPCSPTPISPTPVSPTLDQKVAFRLLIEKKLYLGIKVMSNHILKHRLVFENVFVPRAIVVECKVDAGIMRQRVL